jgi:putative membrane protein
MNIIDKSVKKNVRLFFTGFFMGTADLIPGVSGGTIAFLSGIYEELIYSIKKVTGETVKLALRGKIGEAIKSIPFPFLIPLAVGLFTAVLSLASLLSFLLETYPVYIWSFFFGLVLASTLIVMKRVVKWDLSDKVAFIGAAIGAYILVGLVPVETPDSLPMFFLAGAIAICAMILPGISGSFILLLIGKYQQVLGAVTQRDFLTLGVFMAGCAVGIAVFSRVLSWLFRTHHDISVAILAGFMLGSVRKIWPWKEVVSTRINSHGVEVPLIENNILPASIDIAVIFALFLAGFAIFIVYRLDKLHLVKEQTKDVESKDFEKEYKESLKNQ